MPPSPFLPTCIRWSRPLGLGLALLFGSASALALDVEPGTYTAQPAGNNALGLFYVHAERDARYANGNKLPGHTSLIGDSVQAKYLHYLKAGDLTVAPGFILACGRSRAGGSLAALGEAHGCADPIVGAIFWLDNRPEEKRYFGITPYLSVPVGQYDKTRALNLGENRWKGGINSGISLPLGERAMLDLVGDLQWFGANDEYLGTRRLEQAPLANIQLHLRYPLGPNLRLAASYLHDWGGATSINGIAQHDEKNQGRFRLGIGRSLGPQRFIQVDLGGDTKVENGYRESGRLVVRYVLRF